jgi:hypothetical protein
MSETKIVRVSLGSYKRILQVAAEKGLHVQDAADLLLSEEDQDCNSYVEVVQDFFPFENFESPEKLREYLNRVFKLIEQYGTVQAMFLCPTCGKPIRWNPDGPLGKWLQQQVQQHKWKHGNC